MSVPLVDPNLLLLLVAILLAAVGVYMADHE